MPRSWESLAAFGRSNLWASGADDGQKMLSFSSPEIQCSEGMGGAGGGTSRSIAFSISQDGYQIRTGGGGRGPFASLKGPFTPSQWLELEHQALIYKHIVANVPVPSNLLVPLKRSLCPFGSSGSYASTYLGWAPFHLGFSSSNDPEPGRCRRTDGKKWRCSRDAVPDQKYCERHINRGRHRSRKPVEGQTGHALSGSTTTNLPPITSSSSASVISRTSGYESLGAMKHQFDCLQPNQANTSANHLVNRTVESQCLSLIPPLSGLKSKDTAKFSTKKQMQFEESSESEFGLVSSDALVNPSVSISFMDDRNSDSFLAFNQEEADNRPIHHFMDKWPKDESNSPYVSWPKELKYDWTQLSMGIPMGPPDFSSSSSSPRQEKSGLSKSCELDRIGMCLNVSSNERIEMSPSFVPISWGNSLAGGPLGEALNSTSSSTGTSKSLSEKKQWNSNRNRS